MTYDQNFGYIVDGLRVKVRDPGPISDNYEIYIFRKMEDGYSLVEDMTFKDVPKEEASQRPYPTMMLDPTAIQELMNELYLLGFRPKNMPDETGKVEALEAHLKDLRDILYFFIRNFVGPLVQPRPSAITEEEKEDADNSE
jgi:hypothetical protein